MLILAAQNIYMVLIGRFIAGLSLGAFCVSIPMYTSEISHASIRGMLGTSFQLFLTIGIGIMQVTGYLFSIFIHTSIAIGLAVVFGIFMFFQPESPLFLLRKEKQEAAEQTLLRLRGKDYDPKEEIAELKRFLESGKKEVQVWKSLKTRTAKKSILIIFGSQFIQQLSGINAIGIYTVEILTASGFSQAVIPIIAILFGLVQSLFVVISAILIERLGRKLLLLTSAASLGACTLTYGVFLMMKERGFAEKEEVEKYSIIPVIAYVLYVAFFSIGLGPIPWLLAAELFPDDVKGLLCSCAGALSWGLGFLVARFYMDVAGVLGADIVMLFFTTCMVLGSVFIVFIIFETKGKTLDEIQQMLEE